VKSSLCLAALALVCGCGRPAARPNTTRDGGPAAATAKAAGKTAWGETPVARVGDGVITLERLQQRLRAEIVDSQRSGRPPRDPQALLSMMVDEELLIQQAVRDGALAVDEDVRARLTAHAVKRHETTQAVTDPTPEELRAFYATHRADFPQEERLHVRHLLLKVPTGAVPAEVETIRRRAEKLRADAAAKPASFRDLARVHSQDPSAMLGGELGYLPADRLALVLGPELAGAAGPLKPGAIGPVVRSRSGFHVFELVERSAKDADPLVVQRREILARYRQEQRAKRRDTLMASLRNQFTVDIDRGLIMRELVPAKGP
jgi:parvulin-like peptidyl-prolyl isomerase